MESIDALAQHSFKSQGPSGENKDYLYQLADALRDLSPQSKDRLGFRREGSEVGTPGQYVVKRCNEDVIHQALAWITTSRRQCPICRHLRMDDRSVKERQRNIYGADEEPDLGTT